MQVKSSTDIGALIRDRRQHNALTQADLAARVGVSRAWIIQLEKGKPTVQLRLALRALHVLGVVLDAGPRTALPRSVVDLGSIVDKRPSNK